MPEIQSTFPTSQAIAPLSIDQLPPLPSGQQLQLETAPIVGRCGLGGRLWPSACALCRWQRTVASELEGANILELGAGHGAVGLYAAALGARRVLLTDAYSSQALLDLARRNVAANLRVGTIPRTVVDVQVLRWGEDALEFETPPDYVLAADVIYNRRAHAALCSTLASLVGGGAPTRAVLAHEHRGWRRWRRLRDSRIVSFERTAAASGLRLTTLSTEKQSKFGLRDVSILEVAPA